MNLRACHRCASVTLASSGLCSRCWDRRALTPPAEPPWSSFVARMVAMCLFAMFALAAAREANREPLPSPGFQPSWPAGARPGAIVEAAKPLGRGKP